MVRLAQGQISLFTSLFKLKLLFRIPFSCFSYCNNLRKILCSNPRDGFWKIHDLPCELRFSPVATSSFEVSCPFVM